MCKDKHGSRGGGGGGGGGVTRIGGREGGRVILPEKSLNIGFLSYTGQDALKNHKDAKPAFKLGLQCAKLHLNGISLADQ